MKKCSKILALLLALCMVFALAACSSSDDSSSDNSDEAAAAEEAEPEEEEEAEEEPAEEAEEEETAGEEPAEETESSGENLITADAGMTIDTTGVDLSGLTIGYVTINSSAPWGGRVGTEFVRMAEEAGAKVNSLDAQTNSDDVINYCRQMIDAGVDILGVFGGDPTGMVDIAKECADAGVALFLLGLNVAEEGQEYAISCVGPDQEEAFSEIADYVIDQNGADSDLTVVQISGVPYLEDYVQRERGFQTVIETETNYTLVDPDYAYSSRTDAKTFMENHITAMGGDGIDIVMGYDDDLTMGAVAAIDEAGLTGQIKVYSFIGQKDAMQAVQDGQIEMTVMCRADDIAAETCCAIYEYVTTGSTDYFHYTPLVYVTADNVADYIDLGEF